MPRNWFCGANSTNPDSDPVKSCQHSPWQRAWQHPPRRPMARPGPEAKDDGQGADRNFRGSRGMVKLLDLQI